MSVGLGVDIVEIERMRRILDRTPSFAHKVFTDAEQDYCNRKGNPATVSYTHLTLPTIA